MRHIGEINKQYFLVLPQVKQIVTTHQSQHCFSIRHIMRMEIVMENKNIGQSVSNLVPYEIGTQYDTSVTTKPVHQTWWLQLEPVQGALHANTR